MEKNIKQTILEVSKHYNVDINTVENCLKTAIINAFRIVYPDSIVEIIIDEDNFKMIETKNVIEDGIECIDDEINLSDAIKVDKNAKVGDKVKVEIFINKLPISITGKIHLLLEQQLNFEVNKNNFNNWKKIEGTIVYGTVINTNDQRHITVDIGNGIKGDVRSKFEKDELLDKQKYYFYVQEVENNSKGIPVVLSHNHPKLIEYLLQLNVPEINEGLVKIKDVYCSDRRVYVSVYSEKPEINAVGSVIGNIKENNRINKIASLIDSSLSTKIIILEYSENKLNYVANIIQRVCRIHTSSTVRSQPVKIIGGVYNEQKECFTVVCNNGEGKYIIMSKVASDITKLLNIKHFDVIEESGAQKIDLSYTTYDWYKAQSVVKKPQRVKENKFGSDWI